VHKETEHLVLDVVDTIRRRMERYNEIPADPSEVRAANEVPLPTGSPSSINHARFASLSARLARVAAKASADSLPSPACSHDAVQADVVLRFLTDVRRIADAIAEFASGNCVANRE
jgi:hypothetical protein